MTREPYIAKDWLPAPDKTYTATEFRQRHSEALNFAEAGIPVFIKRGAKTFSVVLQAEAKKVVG